jgi:hypothetical protein
MHEPCVDADEPEVRLAGFAQMKRARTVRPAPVISCACTSRLRRSGAVLTDYFFKLSM